MVQEVSTYLIPARGLKQKVKQRWELEGGSGFHISNPRKGTETFIQILFLSLIQRFPHI